jgi:hypothetical protein
MEIGMTQEMIATEHQEHFALMNWIRTQPIIRDVIIHIANEGKRNPREGNKLKRMGLRAGVFDFFLPIPTNLYHGLWVELKRRKGSKISNEQLEWWHKMKSLNYGAYFAYGWEEAKDIILLYLSSGIAREKTEDKIPVRTEI